MNLFTMLAAQNTAQGDLVTTLIMTLGYVVVIGGFIYFVSVRPQQKKQKELSTMHSNMEVGDSVLTTSGFYGIVIDINEDLVIVEFGNNKNCRIPMKKEAIIEVEKAADGIESGE